MRHILVVDDDLHVGRAIRIWLEQHGFRVSTADGGPNGLAALDHGAPEFRRLATRLGATRCLRKPFKPATLLDVTDECLSQAEPHRRQVAALGAVAVTEQQVKLKSAEIVAMSSEARRADQAGGRA